MKVALVVPQSQLDLARNTPPFNLGYLASYLRKQEPKVEIRIIDGLTCCNVEKEIFLYQPNIVGITCVTPQANAAYQLADTIKRNRPDIKVVLGGVHPSVLPNEAAQHADYVVVGEGEKAIVAIVRDYGKNRLPKIIHAEPIDDIDEIPFPAYDLMNMQAYIKLGTSDFPLLESPVFGLITSRGCPYRCAFCYNSYRRTKPRWNSAEKVIEEILYLYLNYGVKHYFFNDDEFLVNHKRLLKLAKLFKETGLDKRIKWGCQARVESLTPKVVKLVMSMGCVLISSGFENATPRILEFLKHGVTIEKNLKAIGICDVKGLTYGGGFVFGSPTETLVEMKQTRDFFIKHTAIKWMGINTLIPYPGTLVWKVCKKMRLLPENVNYDHLIPTFKPEDTYTINAEDKKTYTRFMHDTYYIIWIINQTRLFPSFRNFAKLMKQKTFWYVALTHPIVLLKTLQNVARRR